MMQSDDLPLVEVIDDAMLEEVFREHDVVFGKDDDAVAQVFFAKEQRSCKAAVARVASVWAALGRRVCDTNTGAYCRARLKIPFEAVREMAQRIASDAEQAFDQEDGLSEQDERLGSFRQRDGYEQGNSYDLQQSAWIRPTKEPAPFIS